MKHKRKCIEKRMYLMRDQAEDAVVNIFTKKGALLSIYECPMCLAFHLTSKENEVSYELKRRIQRLSLKKWFPKRKNVTTLLMDASKQFKDHYGLTKGWRLKPKALTWLEQKEALKQLSPTNNI